MKVFEYNVVQLHQDILSNPMELEIELNRNVESGWELVNLYQTPISVVAVFKRELDIKV